MFRYLLILFSAAPWCRAEVRPMLPPVIADGHTLGWHDEFGGEFVSFFGIVPETRLTKDGVHPDTTGNSAIARAILRSLTPKTR